jgi:hypothetical protein
MTKFSITQLEVARANPIAFARLLKTGQAAPGGFGYPISLRWLNAVMSYHESGKIGDAYSSIDGALRDRKDSAANRRQVASLLTSLSEYEKKVEASNYHLIKSREAIDLRLSLKLRISGQIPLIYMKPDDGYAAYFISKNSPNWRNELKYPILQHYLGVTVFKADPKLIDIGYIDYLSGEFIEECFSSKDLKQAELELKKIAAKISNLM